MASQLLYPCRSSHCLTLLTPAPALVLLCSWPFWRFSRLNYLHRKYRKLSVSLVILRPCPSPLIVSTSRRTAVCISFWLKNNTFFFYQQAFCLYLFLSASQNDTFFFYQQAFCIYLFLSASQNNTFFFLLARTLCVSLSLCLKTQHILLVSVTILSVSLSLPHKTTAIHFFSTHHARRGCVT